MTTYTVQIKQGGQWVSNVKTADFDEAHDTAVHFIKIHGSRNVRVLKGDK